MRLKRNEITPRTPRQARSHKTFDALLREGVVLLQESGVTGFSMITLADRVGVNRSSAYSYFPTKYALFNTLAERYVGSFIQLMETAIIPQPNGNWRSTLDQICEYSARIYNREPTARILFLAGAITPEIEATHHETNNRRVARFIRALFESHFDIPRLAKDPDPYLVSVEATIAVFSLSQRLTQRITSSYVATAQRLVHAYLAQEYAEAGSKR